MFVKVNVTEPEEWKNAVKSVADKFGKVDILVQAAGITGKTGKYSNESKGKKWGYLSIDPGYT